MKHDLKFTEHWLAFCTICCGGEGSLTATDCPGRKMTTEEQDMVYGEGFDFIDWQFVKAPNANGDSEPKQPKETDR